MKDEHPLKNLTTVTWNNIPICLKNAVEIMRK